MGQLLDVGVPLLASHSNHYLVSLICDFSGTVIRLLKIELELYCFGGFLNCYFCKIIIIIIICYVNARTVFCFTRTPVIAIQL